MIIMALLLKIICYYIDCIMWDSDLQFCHMALNAIRLSGRFKKLADICNMH